MTIASEVYRNDYTGNGSTATYAYGFKIFNQAHLLLTVRNTSTEVETTLAITTDYTVTNVGVAAGGNIVLVDNNQAWLDGSGYLATGYTLTIIRHLDLTQETDIRNQGAFYPETHENEFDTIVMQMQQLQEQIDRTIIQPVSSTVDLEFPTPSADKYIGWNDAATGLENKTAPSSTDYPGSFSAGVDASKAASPSAKDIYFATDTNTIYRCAVAGTWVPQYPFYFYSGTDAAKPASPVVGDMYFAKDVGTLYACIVNGAWVTMATNELGAKTAPSGTIVGTTDTQTLTAKTFVTVSTTLSDAATVATNAALGNHFRVTLGGNRTLGNPTNPTDGQVCTWEIIQDGTGSRTLALDTQFTLGTTVSSTTLSTTAAKRDFLTARYNSTATKWYVVGFAAGY